MKYDNTFIMMDTFIIMDRKQLNSIYFHNITYP